MLEKISSLSSYVRENEARVRLLAQELRQSAGNENASLPERGMLHQISKKPLNLRVCAVDSGFVSQPYHGIDVLVVKSAAVHFSYKDSKLLSCDYLPSAFPALEMEYLLGLDEHETGCFKSLMRLKHEISLATGAAEKFSPECLLIDGSLVPLASDRPSKTSVLFPLYLEVISLYKKLYSLCESKNIMLFGVIKDSRAKRFVDIFSISNTSDSFFLNHLLKKGERTFAMSYSEEENKGSVLSDLQPFAGRILAFYIKAGDDFPQRIEFLGKDGKNAVAENNESHDEFASAIYSLCSHNENHAYPAALIEADLCAALTKDDLEVVSRLGSRAFMQPLRRNSRPFR